MSIPKRLADYLDQHGARYDLCLHEHSRSSAETARTARVPPHQLAKSVVLEDDAGCVLAVVPADRSVMVGSLARLLDRRDLHLADEARVAAMFPDCDRGAAPALGMPWGIETVVDDELEASDVVYVECGDHESLLRLSHDQFHDLVSSARHGHFCGERLH